MTSIRIKNLILLRYGKEGDEFSVEGNYPCYQITAGIIHPDIDFIRGAKSRFRIDPVVGDNRVRGVTKSGVYISSNATEFNVHADTISETVFSKLRELKTLLVQQYLDKEGKIFHRLNIGDDTIWHKIDTSIVYHNKIDIEHARLGIYKRKPIR